MTDKLELDNHIKNNPLSFRSFYRYLADKYSLLITAGSDFHGSAKPHIELGMNVEEKILQPFLHEVIKT